MLEGLTYTSTFVFSKQDCACIHFGFSYFDLYFLEILTWFEIKVYFLKIYELLVQNLTDLCLILNINGFHWSIYYLTKKIEQFFNIFVFVKSGLPYIEYFE